MKTISVKTSRWQLIEKLFVGERFYVVYDSEQKLYWSTYTQHKELVQAFVDYLNEVES